MNKEKQTAVAEIGCDEEHLAHCPLYTENPPFNAKTLAAIAEGRAMLRGEIPGKSFHSPEELFEDLHS